MIVNNKEESIKTLDNCRSSYHVKIRREGLDNSVANYRRQLHNCSVPQFKLLFFINKIRQLELFAQKHLQTREMVTSEIQSALEHSQHKMKYQTVQAIIELAMTEKSHLSELLLELLRQWFQLGLRLQKEGIESEIQAMIGVEDLDQDSVYRILKLCKELLIRNKQLCDYYFEADLTLKVIPQFIKYANAGRHEVLLEIVYAAQKNSNHPKRRAAISNLIPILTRVFQSKDDTLKLRAATIITCGIKNNTVELDALLRKVSFLGLLVNTLDTQCFPLKIQILNVIGLIILKTNKTSLFLEFGLLDALSECLSISSIEILKYVIWITNNLGLDEQKCRNQLIENPLFLNFIRRFNNMDSQHHLSQILQKEISTIIINNLQLADLQIVYKLMIERELINQFMDSFQTKTSQSKAITIRILDHLLSIVLEGDKQHLPLVQRSLNMVSAHKKLCQYYTTSEVVAEGCEGLISKIEEVSKIAGNYNLK